MTATKPNKIYIVSDGTGRTCEQVVKSALVQFGDEPTDLVVVPGVRDDDAVRKVVSDAKKDRAIIFFTLVSDEARRIMKVTADEQFVESVDVLGPVFSGLNSIIHRMPASRPGLYYRSERQHFDRMDAIDYTLKHDDGMRMHELSQADIVLVGVSRASKSSTCFFLAYRGIRAANVPLLTHTPPPRELTEVDSRRVIGLSINCKRLVAVRRARMHSMGVDDIESYSEMDAVAQEIRSAHDQMAQHNWRSIDVSYLAIEEIAKRVIFLMEEEGLRRRPRRPRNAQ
jgi:regulator of PEP synthase PpsR (kinase-PPPase family)